MRDRIHAGQRPGQVEPEVRRQGGDIRKIAGEFEIMHAQALEQTLLLEEWAAFEIEQERRTIAPGIRGEVVQEPRLFRSPAAVDEVDHGHREGDDAGFGKNAEVLVHRNDVFAAQPSNVEAGNRWPGGEDERALVVQSALKRAIARERRAALRTRVAR